MMFDGKAFGEEIVSIVRDYVDKEVAALKAENADLHARLKAVEDRPEPVIEIPELPEIVIPELPDFGPMIEDAVGKAIAALPAPEKGKDAAGIVEALKDSGELVLTLQDGRLIRTGVRDGEKGKDGRDGFELTNYDEWFEDDGRTLVRRYEMGEDFKEFRHQTVLPRYRNVFKQGESYTRGDIVTWGGSTWHCEKDTTEKPDGEDWSLMVKKGRDGKDAK